MNLTDEQKHALARAILEFQSREHDRGRCACDEEGHLCEYGRFQQGLDSADEIIEDYPDKAQAILENWAIDED